MSKTIILVALATEFNSVNLPHDVKVVYTGVGKVNAALATSIAISENKPNQIINYGTAGGISTDCKGLVKVNRVIQRDMNAEPLAPRGITPLSDGPHHFLSGQHGITCGTGDSFVTSRDEWLHENAVDVVDMELFAIAATAHRMGVSWSAYKFISDSADADSANEWQEKVSQGELLFLVELENLGLL